MNTEWTVYLPMPADPRSIPLSFLCGGRRITGMDESFSPRMLSDETEGTVRTIVWEGTDSSGLTIRTERKTYADYPVVEWLAFLENRGCENSAPLSDIRLGVCTLPLKNPTLQYSNGDNRRQEAFSRFETVLTAPFSLEPEGGTSCCGAFPYMRLTDGDRAVNLAIGWPGHWCAEFTPDADGTRIAVGQKNLALYLKPGEIIRLPRVTLMLTEGGEDISRNTWRRWFIEHILVRENGEPLKPKLCMHYYLEGDKPEHTGATEQGQIEAMGIYHENGIHPDIWWMDAGWYPCDYDWPRTGTWRPDPVRFPHGLAPLGEACKKYGMQYLLWFEPERVRAGTELYEEHPEWMLHIDDSRPEKETCMLNLADPDCQDWIIERIDSIITESGVSIYRQDFNINSPPPESFWNRYDEEGRTGALENHHIQGYLKLWDTLRERHPGLWVDSCASGGRRNDLESMRRGVPLHYTDVGYGNHPIKQMQHRLHFEWIPYFRAHNMVWDQPDGTYTGSMHPDRWYDEFSFQAAMAPSLTSMLHIRGQQREYEAARLMHPIWRRAAEMMLRADYYPLSECRADPHDWYAMQFFDPRKGDGFVQILRNIAADEESFTACLCALEPDARYRFTDAVSGTTFVLSGKEGADGITARIPKRSAVLYFYEKL